LLRQADHAASGAPFLEGESLPHPTRARLWRIIAESRLRDVDLDLSGEIPHGTPVTPATFGCHDALCSTPTVNICEPPRVWEGYTERAFRNRVLQVRKLDQPWSELFAEGHGLVAPMILRDDNGL